MKVALTIWMLFLGTLVNAQTECRDVTPLMEKLWKHETGSSSWRKVSDSVLTICPNSAKLWGDRAMAYMLRGEFAEGMKYLNKAAKLDPHYFLGSRAWYRLHYLHDWGGVIHDLDTLEKMSGRSFVYVTNIHMYMLKGLAYAKADNIERAFYCYNLAIEEQVKTKGENWVGTYDYLLRGILHYRTGHIEEAIADLTRQVKEYESLADTYYYRGLAYAEAGRKDEARLDLQHAKDLMLGEGQKRWDNLFVIPDEVFLSDVESALLRLY